MNYSSTFTSNQDAGKEGSEDPTQSLAQSKRPSFMQ